MKEKIKEGMLLLVECEDCKHKFEIGQNDKTEAVKVTYTREFKVNDESIFLTYYDCPKCGRRHFVQIDDKTSLRKLASAKNMFVKLSVANLKGKEIPEKQLVKFKKTRQNLSDYRLKLMKRYTGKKIYDEESKLTSVLRFSV